MTKDDTSHVAITSGARLATRPNLTGSSLTTKTIGIVAVAAFAAESTEWAERPRAITAT